MIERYRTNQNSIFINHRQSFSACSFEHLEGFSEFIKWRKGDKFLVANLSNCILLGIEKKFSKRYVVKQNVIIIHNIDHFDGLAIMAIFSNAIQHHLKSIVHFHSNVICSHETTNSA